LVRRITSNDKIVGSNPARGIFLAINSIRLSMIFVRSTYYYVQSYEIAIVITWIMKSFNELSNEEILSLLLF
jgi:hypothetical protein